MVTQLDGVHSENKIGHDTSWALQSTPLVDGDPKANIVSRFIRHRQSPQANAMLVWDGHSCPSTLDSDLKMPKQMLARMYEYRRKLPHYRNAGRDLFITFCKGHRTPFSSETSDAILTVLLHDHGKRYELHAIGPATPYRAVILRQRSSAPQGGELPTKDLMARKQVA
jgi:hypothetical protein